MEADRRLTFERFCLDFATEQLLCGDEVVALTPEAFTVLRRLGDDGGQLVTKEELLRAGWAKTHVSDGVLKVSILETRRALGDDPAAPALHRDHAAPGLPLHRPPHASGKDPVGGRCPRRTGPP
jgi:DNA-binding winged helix-turn-helix (wHTH) protein